MLWCQGWRCWGKRYKAACPKATRRDVGELKEECFQFLLVCMQEFHSVLSPPRPTVPLLWINGSALFYIRPSAQGGRMKQFAVLDTAPLCFCLRAPMHCSLECSPPPQSTQGQLSPRPARLQVSFSLGPLPTGRSVAIFPL